MLYHYTLYYCHYLSSINWNWVTPSSSQQGGKRQPRWSYRRPGSGTQHLHSTFLKSRHSHMAREDAVIVYPCAWEEEENGFGGTKQYVANTTINISTEYSQIPFYLFVCFCFQQQTQAVFQKMLWEHWISLGRCWKVQASSPTLWSGQFWDTTYVPGFPCRQRMKLPSVGAGLRVILACLCSVLSCFPHSLTGFPQEYFLNKSLAHEFSSDDLPLGNLI